MSRFDKMKFGTMTNFSAIGQTVTKICNFSILLRQISAILAFQKFSKVLENPRWLTDGQHI